MAIKFDHAVYRYYPNQLLSACSIIGAGTIPSAVTTIYTLGLILFKLGELAFSSDETSEKIKQDLSHLTSQTLLLFFLQTITFGLHIWNMKDDALHHSPAGGLYPGILPGGDAPEL